MHPEYWKKFLELHSLVGKEFSIPEERDVSTIGADFEILSEEMSIEEAKHYWPGIGVYPNAFIPVGSCLIGSGDPYFINSKDGPKGPLYRIYHDQVHDEDYDKDSAIDLVLENYESLIEYPVLYSVWSQDGNGKNTELQKDLSCEKAKAIVQDLKDQKDRKKYWHDQTK